MDLVPGIRFVDGVRAHYRRYAESKGRTLEDLEEEQKELVSRTVSSCRTSSFAVVLSFLAVALSSLVNA